MRKFSDLRGYQQRTITYLYEHEQAQLVVPMGGGKTAIALTAMGEMMDDGVISKGLVIAPKKVAYQVWPQEPEQWEHLSGIRVLPLSGAPETRLDQLMYSSAPILSVGLDIVPWLCSILKTLPEDHPLFDCLVIDESSKLKSPRGAWGKALTNVIGRFRNRWFLTGTPRPNGYMDQFRPLALLTDGKIWGTRSFDTWRNKHFIANDHGGYDWRIRPEHEAKIIKKIASVTVTIDDAEMPDLPPLTNVWHWIDLPERARDQYDRMERKLVADLGGDMEKIIAASEGVATGKLGQITQGFIYSDTHVHKMHNEKMHVLQRLVDEELNDQPALLSWHFDEDLRRVQELWPDMPFIGSGTSDKDALLYDKAWNKGMLPLLGLHPASAAHGLNLQFGGQQMILLDMPWSAELYDQLIKRFYRPGQTRHCFVHHIMARDTIDEAKYERVTMKISEQEAFKRYLRRV